MRNRFLSIIYQAVYHVYGIFRTHIASNSMKRGQLLGTCLVLGSAPDPIIPKDFDETWFLMTINASQASVLKYNMQPNATVMSDRMFEQSPANISGKQAIQNCRTQQLFLIQRGHSICETRKILQELNYSFEEFIAIDHWARSRITHKILGSYLAISSGGQKISTGIFASLLAYYLGASSVVLSGFSLTKNGHAYNSLNHKRHHISFDKKALSLVQEKRLPFYAADRTFSNESGLPEWKE